MSVIEKALDAITQRKEASEENNSSGGWVGALIASILVFVITGVLGFVAWSRGKELAKLKHEKAVREEEAHQARVAAKIAATTERRDEAIARADEAAIRVQELQERRKKLEEDYNEARKRIRDVTTWDGIDAELASRRTSSGDS